MTKHSLLWRIVLNGRPVYRAILYALVLWGLITSVLLIRADGSDDINLRFVTPQKITNATFNGPWDGAYKDGIPAFSPGDSVPVVGEKCNDSDEPIATHGSLSIQRVGPDNRAPGFLLSTGSRVRQTGCVVEAFLNPLPFGLIPGIYEISGVSTEDNGARATFVVELFWVIGDE